MVVSDSLFQNNSALQAPGIYGEDVAWLSVQNCTFAFNNARGGVIKTVNSQGVIQKCDFKSNTGTSMGVCVTLEKSAKFSVQSSFFFNNTGTDKGIIALDQNTTGYIQHCNFKQNKIVYGTVFVRNSSIVWVTHSNFSNNTAVNGGAVCAETEVELHLKFIRFENNFVTGSGGSIYAVRGTTIVVRRSVFVAQGAAFRGGCFYTESTTLNLTSNLFLTISDDILNVQGNSKVTILNCSISNCNSSFVKAFSSHVMISNSVIFNNTVVNDDFLYLSCGSALSIFDSSIYQNVQASISAGVMIRAVSNSFFKIRSNFLWSNILYGFAVVTNGKAIVQNCEFENNSATFLSMCTLQSKSQLLVEQSTFKGNTGHQPGAIVHATDSSSVTWENTLAVDNKGTAAGSGGDTGGGVFFGSTTNTTIKDSTFLRNGCNDPGLAARILCNKPCFLEIINSSLTNNYPFGSEFFLQNVTHINIESSSFLLSEHERLFFIEGTGATTMRISKSEFRSSGSPAQLRQPFLYIKNNDEQTLKLNILTLNLTVKNRHQAIHSENSSDFVHRMMKGGFLACREERVMLTHSETAYSSRK